MTVDSVLQAVIDQRAALFALVVLYTPPGVLIASRLILVSILIALFVAALPIWPHSKPWRYGPAGLIALATFIIIIVIGISRR